MPSELDGTSRSETAPRPATFSIVARDPASEAVGVAVHSKFISVGSVVPFASADAGAIATQSFANVAYGPEGLDLLREGRNASEAIGELTAGDADAPQRQVGIVGEDGSVAAFTGEECFEYAGDLQGKDYTVQGNILANRDTLEAMATAFEPDGTDEGGDESEESEHVGNERAIAASGERGFPERLLAALRAGNEAGGDRRGEQSAALYVAKPEGGYAGGNDRWIDDHDDSITELEHVFKLYDVTLLEREESNDLRELSDETASEVRETFADLDLYESVSDRENAGNDESNEGAFGEHDREALENFRAVNNFENHSSTVLEDAISRGWTKADGNGEERLIDAIWNGLSRLERK